MKENTAEPFIIEPHNLTAPRFERICEMLNAAFFDYPFGRYAFPDPAERVRRAPGFFRLMARYGLRYGESWLTSMNIEGAVMWLPPEAPSMTNARMLRCGLLQTAWQVGFKNCLRVMTLSDKLEEIHKRMAPYPHWYGLIVGVHPDRQRQGHARRMINAKLRQVDQTGTPVYIETQSQTNVEFYQKLGFVVVDECQIRDCDITSWAMIRKA